MPQQNSAGHRPTSDRGGGRGRRGGEFAMIDAIRRSLPEAPPGELWIGDDAAIVAAGEGSLLLTTDLCVAGVHVDPALVGLDDMGWKAVSVAVSDIAAMGGQPGHAVVGVAGPPDTDLAMLYRGVADAASTYRCPVVGGDLSEARQLVVSVTVTGTVPDGPPPVRRSGASPGDHLFVTGPLGASAAGLRRLRAGTAPADDDLALRHRRPRALVAHGAAARHGGASAMIDVSDGFAADVRHLAVASEVGVDLDVVPEAPGATVDDALGGGEDYELVVAAADGARLAAAFAATGLAPPIVVGVCTAEPGVFRLQGGELPERGWEHPWDRPWDRPWERPSGADGWRHD